MESWETTSLPVPSYSDRSWPTVADTPWKKALRLLIIHHSILMTITERNSSSFLAMTTLYSQKERYLQEVFEEDLQRIPSLIAELSPLITPKIKRLIIHLRSRLTRRKQWLPLTRLREQDPSCMRKNARLPGRTIIEKAGPKQVLMGIKRVQYFDTTENRYLRSCCEKIRNLCLEQLRIYRALDVQNEHRKKIVSLQRLVEGMLEDPRLERVGRIRGGEKPSNTMLGNADYRSIWRLWSLFRAQEDQFVSSWKMLHHSWAQILLMAIWNHIHEEWKEFRAVDTWFVSESKEPRRISLNGPMRRWICVQRDYLGEVCISFVPQNTTIHLLFVVHNQGEEIKKQMVLFPRVLHQDEGGNSADLVLGEEGTSTEYRLQAMIAAEEWISQWEDMRSSKRESSSHSFQKKSLYGIFPLDIHMQCCGRDSSTEEKTVHQQELFFVEKETPEGEQVVITGWSAGWDTQAYHVENMFGRDAKREEILAASQLLERYRGERDTAVVLSDSWNYEQLSFFTSSFSGSWFLWATVALALGASEDGSMDFVHSCAVVCCSDVGLDMRILKREERENGWTWVRTREKWKSDFQKNRSYIQEVYQGWNKTQQGWKHEDPTSYASPRQEILSFLQKRDYTHLLVYGISDLDVAYLRKEVGIHEITVVPPTMLAQGALVFLERHQHNLPTWEDELPQLQMIVEEDRQRKNHVLFPERRFLSPGERCILSVRERVFFIRKGEEEFRIPMIDEYQDEYSAVCSGRPLPLEVNTKVFLQLDFTHGREGIRGTLIPFQHSASVRIPFLLRYTVPEEYYKPLKPKFSYISSDIVDKIQAGIPRGKSKKKKGKKQNLVDFIQVVFEQTKDLEKYCEPEIDRSILKKFLLDNRKKNIQKEFLECKIKGVSFKISKRYQSEFVSWMCVQIFSNLSLYPEELYTHLFDKLRDGKCIPLEKGYKILGFWITTEKRWERFLSLDPKKNHTRLCWLQGISSAIRNPSTKIRLESLGNILDIVHNTLQSLEPEKKNQQQFFRCFVILRELCRFRSEEHSFLQPKNEKFTQILAFLMSLREVLPLDVIRFGESDIAYAQGEALSQAIDALKGNYRAIMRGDV